MKCIITMSTILRIGDYVLRKGGEGGTLVWKRNILVNCFSKTIALLMCKSDVVVVVYTRGVITNFGGKVY